jgi:cation:H+ antiporter
MEHLWIWTQFAIASVLIVVAGSRLSRYADIISEKLKLGHVFVGMVFLGWITSLPELVLSLGSTIYVGEPDLAIGNVLGSCLFNLTILVVADILIVRGLFFTRTARQSAVTGIASFIILFLAAVGLMLPNWLRIPAVLGIDLFSWVIIIFYVGSTAFLYRHDKKSGVPDEGLPAHEYASVSMVGVAVMSVVATAIIVGAGLYLADLGDKIALKYGMSHSFVGTLFFAVVSSLPELSTTLAAARLGFFNMCLGNIFGSNIFNIMIISVSDIFYREGSIIAAPASDSRFYLFCVALFAIIATTAVVVGVRLKSRKLFWRISWVSLVVIACYILGLFLSRLL